VRARKLVKTGGGAKDEMWLVRMAARATLRPWWGRIPARRNGFLMLSENSEIGLS